MQKSLRFSMYLDFFMILSLPCRITAVLIFEMVATIDGSVSALQANSMFTGVVVVPFTPMSMPQAGDTTVGLLKTYAQDF